MTLEEINAALREENSGYGGVVLPALLWYNDAEVSASSTGPQEVK